MFTARSSSQSLFDRVAQELAGKFFFSDDKRKPARLVIDGKNFSLTLNKSREVLVHDVWGTEQCRPFVTDAFDFTASRRVDQCWTR